VEFFTVTSYLLEEKLWGPVRQFEIVSRRRVYRLDPLHPHFWGFESKAALGLSREISNRHGEIDFVLQALKEHN